MQFELFAENRIDKAEHSALNLISMLDLGRDEKHRYNIELITRNRKKAVLTASNDEYRITAEVLDSTGEPPPIYETDFTPFYPYPMST